MTTVNTISELCASYKSWVSQNPQVVGDFESTVKWVSYFIAGRINNSTILSELVYSLSNLLVLFNDRIIQSTKRGETIATSAGEKLKAWLTVLEYSEVFVEVSARKVWGIRGKWLTVITIQIIKCIGRLVLLFHFKENIIQIPPMPALKRKKLADPGFVEEAQIRLNSSFTLKRSGRVIRTVGSAPPVSCRLWKPLQPPNNNPEEDVTEEHLHGKRLIAEVLYILKPVVHLGAMRIYGEKKWKPWLLALAMDTVSLRLFRMQGKALSHRQRLELSRRTVALLLYFIRSPFYEKYSGDRLQCLLNALSNNLPLVRIVCNPLAQYIPIWQDTYFYMWSS